ASATTLHFHISGEMMHPARPAHCRSQHSYLLPFTSPLYCASPRPGMEWGRERRLYPQRVEDTLWIACVGDAPVVVNPALSIGDA
ncbi:MAG: hypothetical protein ACI31D_05965, partial [Candidatus Limisoma sp.]